MFAGFRRAVRLKADSKQTLSAASARSAEHFGYFGHANPRRSGNALDGTGRSPAPVGRSQGSDLPNAEERNGRPRLVAVSNASRRDDFGDCGQSFGMRLESASLAPHIRRYPDFRGKVSG
jgi:hypothetical protein